MEGAGVGSLARAGAANKGKADAKKLMNGKRKTRQNRKK